MTNAELEREVRSVKNAIWILIAALFIIGILNSGSMRTLAKRLDALEAAQTKGQQADTTATSAPPPR